MQYASRGGWRSRGITRNLRRAAGRTGRKLGGSSQHDRWRCTCLWIQCGGPCDSCRSGHSYAQRRHASDSMDASERSARRLF